MRYIIYLVALFNLYYLLNFIQQAHYHLYSIKDLLKRIVKDQKNYLLICPLVFLFIPSDRSFYIYIVILAIIILGFYVVLRVRTKLILKLKFTARIRRIIICNLFFYGLFFAFSSLIHPVDSVVLIFSPLIVYLSLIVLMPVEKMVQLHFVKKAKDKLRETKPFVIGITGSAGKTTTKSIVYQLLKNDYITFATPKSYNTLNGITRSINEDMNEATEVMIIEYGASQLGDIEESLRVIKSDISLITNIGVQHLETFKTKENIIKEKTKIIGGSKLHICNVNREYDIPSGVEVITIGKDYHENCDYWASELTYRKDGMYFAVHEKRTNTKTIMKTKLLGAHNVCNVLFGIAVLRHLKQYKMTMKEISYRVSNLEGVKNRLELMNVNSKYVINDSFNSNREGFLEALKIMEVFPSRRILITPGIVSGGVDMASINKEVALKICDIVDEVYLVSSMASDYLKEIFDNKLIEYNETSSFKEAYERAIKDDAVKTILIENDISDIYKR